MAIVVLIILVVGAENRASIGSQTNAMYSGTATDAIGQVVKLNADCYVDCVFYNARIHSGSLSNGDANLIRNHCSSVCTTYTPDITRLAPALPGLQ